MSFCHRIPHQVLPNPHGPACICHALTIYTIWNMRVTSTYHLHIFTLCCYLKLSKHISFFLPCFLAFLLPCFLAFLLSCFLVSLLPCLLPSLASFLSLLPDIKKPYETLRARNRDRTSRPVIRLNPPACGSKGCLPQQAKQPATHKEWNQPINMVLFNN